MTSTEEDTVELLPPDAEQVAQKSGRRPVVYLVQETTLNVAPAARYGELRVLIPGGVQLLLTPQPVVRAVRGKLRDYTADDFILPVGDPLAIGVVTALAADVSGGVVRLLKWDQQERRYYQCLLRLWGRGA